MRRKLITMAMITKVMVTMVTVTMVMAAKNQCVVVDKVMRLLQRVSA